MTSGKKSTSRAPFVQVIRRTLRLPMSPRRGSGPRSSLRFGLALLMLLAGVIPALALADESSLASQPSLSLLQETVDPQAATESPITDPVAAEELPHQGLGREEAVELTEAVFAPVFQNAVGPLQNLEAERYLGDNAAIVAADTGAEAGVEINGDPSSSQPVTETQQLVLLESTLPLRTTGPEGDPEPVDLSLESTPDYLVPKSPLVDVRMPRELGDGIELPEDGITINLQNVPDERAPSVAGDIAATYPNVAADTDFSVVSTPTGVETMMTLRTGDARRSAAYQLHLPAGAMLHQVGEGAEVDREGQTLLKVQPPTAIDANGMNVPVDLSVADDVVTVTASPGESTAYPVLVDPLFESYDWFTYQATTGQNTWHSYSNAGGMETSTNAAGLFIRARAEGFQYKPNDNASWQYFVPRLKEEEAKGRTPSSYVLRMNLWHLAFVTDPAGSATPSLIMGIIGATGWVGLPGGVAAWGYAGNAPPFYMNPGKTVDMTNGEPAKRDETAKIASVSVVASANTTAAHERLAAIGSAAIEVADTDSPGTSNGSISPWVNQTATSSLTATAEDKGLGVKNIGFELPWKGPQVVANSCQGTVSNPCPLTWTATLPASQYNPAEMPQGFVYIPIDAEDPLGNKATHGFTKALVKVDHTAPSLSVAGSLTEQASLGTSGSQYALKYNVADGDTVAPEALVPFGGAGTGEGKTQRPTGIATDPAGNVWVVDRENSRVEKFDASGKFLMQFGSPGNGTKQFNDPRGIAISSTGNIWVSEVGNKRVQEFDINGNYVRMITGFTEPYGLATGPGEVLWISDPAKHEILKYKETGTYLAKAYGSASNPTGPSALGSPIGLATDPAGNLWTADAANNRLVKFNSSGQFSGQFGSAAQFKAPNFLAVAPSGHIFVTEDPGTRLHVVRSDGTSLRDFGTLGTGNDQLTEPRSVALGANGVTYVADAGNHRITRWTHGDYDPQSGVAKVEVKVDGQLKSTPFNQTCAANSCPASGEWIYKANEFSTGSHKVEVTATDGAGIKSAPQSLPVASIKDEAAPQLTASSAFFNAPAGWLDQKTYSYTTVAKDTGGSGVVSFELKINGKVVSSASGVCPNGGCERTLTGSINVANYPGGAYPAELIAKDAVGRITKKLWTMNVNPAGIISGEEATDTLEAVEGTTEDFFPVASTEDALEAQVIAAGDDPGFKSSEGVIQSTGVPVDVTISPVNQAVTIDGTAAPVEITPLAPGSASAPTIRNGVAAVAPNVAKGVDNVVRPEYNGALFFTTIRESASPEQFSWHVKLNPGQSLKSVNDQFAEVVFEDGTTMMLISCEAARDATGKAVTTSLAVDGSNVVLTVAHHAAGVVYPVTAGPAFEVGYSTVIVTDPAPLVEGGETEDFEAAERAETANETPLSPGEFNDVSGWLWSGAAHRDPDKPVTLKQAKRLARVHRVEKEIAAPRLDLIGGPGANGSGGWERVYNVRARVCSDLICDIWDVEFADETNFSIAKPGSNSANTTVYASPYGPVHCGSDVNFWWQFNLDIETFKAGTRGPTVVYRNSGDHLALWCKFDIEIYVVAEVPGEFFEKQTVLIDQIFPNGLQRTVIQPWDWWYNHGIWN